MPTQATMLTIYATKKLRDDWPVTNTQGMPATTVLGDWYADILYVEPEVVLFMSERAALRAGARRTIHESEHTLYAKPRAPAARNRRFERAY
jgi:hypothetical protein